MPIPLPTEPTLYHADGRAETYAPANGRQFTLRELQTAVDGYIEIVNLHATGADGKRWLMVVNELGLLIPLSFNSTGAAFYRQATGTSEPIVGDVLVCPARMID
jgi:hypothetical protein